MAAQICKRTYGSEKFLEGVWRFCLGLGKKVLIANVIAGVADKTFGVEAHTLPLSAAWLGAFCYALQIYFEFSGYSDMAIGLGKMLGLEFLENFNFPYISASFTEFWRRWHISLSNWMREYLYIPLGGNREGRGRTYANLWIVFVLSGFWHGASWNFVVWGAYHGMFLSIEKFARGRLKGRLPRIFAIPRTFLLVLIGWVFFRADTLSNAVSYLGAMLGRSTTVASDLVPAEIMSGPAWAALVGGAIFSLAPLIRGHALFKDWPIDACTRHAHARVGVRFACSFVLLIASLMCLIAGQFNPFIYFRF